MKNMYENLEKVDGGTEGKWNKNWEYGNSNYRFDYNNRTMPSPIPKMEVLKANIIWLQISTSMTHYQMDPHLWTHDWWLKDNQF